jgi:hypothetical protein
VTDALRTAWRRVRGLPAAAQVGLVLAIVAAYTAGLLALTGGGSDDGNATPERKPLSAAERRVKGLVEQGRVPQRDETDVPEFRAAEVGSVTCDGPSCSVVYRVAVPGRGRILLQQVDVVRRIFGEADVDRLKLRVVRGTPTGPLASPKSEEETPLNVPLLETDCNRAEAPRGTDWSDLREGTVAFGRMCEVTDLFQGAPGAGSSGE